jgi:hypothetical protein
MHSASMALLRCRPHTVAQTSFLNICPSHKMRHLKATVLICASLYLLQIVGQSKGHMLVFISLQASHVVSQFDWQESLVVAWEPSSVSSSFTGSTESALWLYTLSSSSSSSWPLNSLKRSVSVFIWPSLVLLVLLLDTSKADHIAVSKWALVVK